MREYGEYAACPCCGEMMQFARTITHVDLPPMEALECKACGLVTEVSNRMHALIERRFSY
jgi:uncharacterized Zn finger protein